MKKTDRADGGNETALAICTLLILVMVFSACDIGLAYTGGGVSSGPDPGAGGTGSDYVISLRIDPANATIYAGHQRQFTAFATILGSDGNVSEKDVSSDVIWQCSIGDITQNGGKYIFTGREAGTGTVKAIYGTASAEATITVYHGPVAHINITANSNELVNSPNLTKSVTIAFGLKAVDDYGNAFQIPDAYWTCSNESVGSITQTGVFRFNDAVINDTGEFNRSFLDLSDAVNATGWINVSNAESGDALTVDGITFTKSATYNSTANCFNTSADLKALINAKTNVTASGAGDNLTLTAKTAGSAGNSITLASSSENITVSGHNLTGGKDGKYVMQISAYVSADTYDTINLILYANTPGTDNVTSDDVLLDPSDRIYAKTVANLMAIQTVAANDWDFGTVYPGTPTGWTKVTFKNIGTCSITVAPQAPGSDSLYQYLYFRDYGSTGDGVKIGSYSVELPISPIYDYSGRIVSFSSETKTVEMRLVPPSDITGLSTEGALRYVVAAL